MSSCYKICIITSNMHGILLTAAVKTCFPSNVFALANAACRVNDLFLALPSLQKHVEEVVAIAEVKYFITNSRTIVQN